MIRVEVHMHGNLRRFLPDGVSSVELDLPDGTRVCDVIERLRADDEIWLASIGEDVVYRIPLVPNARRFRRGHRIRLTLSSDDWNPEMPVIMNFRHATVGTSSINTVRSSSRLLLPVLKG